MMVKSEPYTASKWSLNRFCIVAALEALFEIFTIAVILLLSFNINIKIVLKLKLIYSKKIY